MDTGTSIPTITAAGSEYHVAGRMLRACESPGAFILDEHGLPAAVLDDALAAADWFFALPLQEKERLHYRDGNFHRGYVPSQGERSDPSGLADLKEAFDCGLELAQTWAQQPAGVRVCSPNQWPGRPAFKSAVEACLDHMLALSRRLFRLLALGLHLPTDVFDSRIDQPMAQLRLLRYPALGPRKTMEAAPGIGAHRDYECLTILVESGSPGLEIECGGRWLPVAAPAGGCVVLVGEMLSAWTGGRCRAAPHRVASTEGTRTVLAFFFAPNPDVPLTGVDDGRNTGTTVTAGDFLMRRLREDQHASFSTRQHDGS